MERRLAAILAVDVVDYTRLMGDDQAGTLDALRQLRNDLLEPSVSKHNGSVVKRMGDGWIVEFSSVSDAVECAMHIHEGLAGDDTIRLRTGIHIGDVVFEEEDVFGDGVNMAARLEQLAEPGEVLISDTAHQSLDGKAAALFGGGNSHQLKNISRAVQVWRWPANSILEAKLIKADYIESPTHSGKPSIAVLPFNNMSGDPEQEYFSDGITEDIITDLSKISALFVVARNTTFSYKNQSHNLQDVARELSVTNLVEGSVRKAGNRVRITAQLIDGDTGGHLWAERYDRDLTDIFAVQDEITREIVEALKVMLKPGEKPITPKPQTRNVEAYDLYLRGRRQQHMFTRAGLTTAKDLFEQAIKFDPNYARAYCGIADCCAFLCIWFGRHEELSAELVDRSAKALELAPALAEAHASRGLAFHLEDDNNNAELSFTKAVELNPNLYETYYYWGRACLAQGKTKEAAKHFYDAYAASPHDDQAPAILAQVLLDLGRTDEMKQMAQISVDNALRKFELEPENIRACLFAALGFYRLGDLTSAEKQLEMAQSSDLSIDFGYNMACLYALIGNKDQALHLLELSVKKGMIQKAWVENDSDLDSLRDHPKFFALLKLLG